MKQFLHSFIVIRRVRQVAEMLHAVSGRSSVRRQPRQVVLGQVCLPILSAREGNRASEGRRMVYPKLPRMHEWRPTKQLPEIAQLHLQHIPC